MGLPNDGEPGVWPDSGRAGRLMTFPYTVDKRVSGIYLADSGGTALSNGTVVAVDERPDGDYWVTVQLDGVTDPKRYHVSKSGRSDYLQPREFEVRDS